eukprot:GHVP01045602.1.p1 GENE.GHVP01045602.1~~GHVP01045602.1.p1  ORF type:complete len:1086 (-),score=253.07 GHVP01045602.1:1144-4401(-)
MYIRTVLVENFKVFCSPASFVFCAGFNTISGPNGSGKSCLLEAIALCFTCDLSLLRVNSLTDFSSKKEQVPEGKIVIDLIDESTEEHKINCILHYKPKATRTPYREFRLDNKAIKMRALRDWLRRKGLSVDGASYAMFQNQRFPLEHSSTINNLIREGSGSKMFEERVSKIQNLDEQSAIIYSTWKIIKEKFKQLELLKSMKARETGLTSEKENLKESLRKLKHKEYCQQAEKYETEIGELRSLIAKAEEHLEKEKIKNEDFLQIDFQNKLEIQRKKKAKISQKIRHLQTFQHLQETKNSIEQKKKGLEHLKLKLEKCLASSETFQIEISALERKITTLDSELEVALKSESVSNGRCSSIELAKLQKERFLSFNTELARLNTEKDKMEANILRIELEIENLKQISNFDSIGEINPLEKEKQKIVFSLTKNRIKNRTQIQKIRNLLCVPSILYHNEKCTPLSEAFRFSEAAKNYLPACASAFAGFLSSTVIIHNEFLENGKKLHWPSLKYWPQDVYKKNPNYQINFRGLADALKVGPTGTKADALKNLIENFENSNKKSVNILEANNAILGSDALLAFSLFSIISASNISVIAKICHRGLMVLAVNDEAAVRILREFPSLEVIVCNGNRHSRGQLSFSDITHSKIHLIDLLVSLTEIEIQIASETEQEKSLSSRIADLTQIKEKWDQIRALELKLAQSVKALEMTESSIEWTLLQRKLSEQQNKENISLRPVSSIQFEKNSTEKECKEKKLKMSQEHKNIMNTEVEIEMLSKSVSTFDEDINLLEESAENLIELENHENSLVEIECEIKRLECEKKKFLISNEMIENLQNEIISEKERKENLLEKLSWISENIKGLNLTFKSQEDIIMTETEIQSKLISLDMEETEIKGNLERLKIKNDQEKEIEEKLTELSNIYSTVESTLLNLKDGLQKMTALKDYSEERTATSCSNYIQKTYPSFFPAITPTINSKGDPRKFELKLNYRHSSDGNVPLRVESISGGQKSLLSICLLLAVASANPSFVYLFDEVDFALDDFLASKLGQLLNKFLWEDGKALGVRQLIAISHRPSLLKFASNNVRMSATLEIKNS